MSTELLLCTRVHHTLLPLSITAPIMCAGVAEHVCLSENSNRGQRSTPRFVLHLSFKTGSLAPETVLVG